MPLIPTHHFFAAAMFFAEKPLFVGGLSGFGDNACGCADAVGAVGWAEARGCRRAVGWVGCAKVC